MSIAMPDPIPPSNIPHRPTDDSESVYYEGSPLLRGELGKVAAWGSIGLVLLVLVVLDLVKWHWDLPKWIVAIVGLVGLLMLLVPPFSRKTLVYRITNYRIDVTTGILARNTDTLELWHVEDIRLHRSFMNRLMGVGLIEIYGRDAATPKMSLRGLPHPQTLFRELEQRVIAVKRQQGVIKVDPGQ
jgi:membrane protein YdbS with pleckstrin-like domain